MVKVVYVNLLQKLMPKGRAQVYTFTQSIILNNPLKREVISTRNPGWA